MLAPKSHTVDYGKYLPTTNTVCLPPNPWAFMAAIAISFLLTDWAHN